MDTDKERARRQAALEAQFAKAGATVKAAASPAPRLYGRLCTNCLYQGDPKSVTPGSIIIELFLWLCFLLPGLLYSLWRLSARHKACPSCGAKNMIPVNSPAARKLLG